MDTLKVHERRLSLGECFSVRCLKVLGCYKSYSLIGDLARIEWNFGGQLAVECCVNPFLQGSSTQLPVARMLWSVEAIASRLEAIPTRTKKLDGELQESRKSSNILQSQEPLVASLLHLAPSSDARSP